jgi:hypothetical protein
MSKLAPKIEDEKALGATEPFLLPTTEAHEGFSGQDIYSYKPPIPEKLENWEDGTEAKLCYNLEEASTIIASNNKSKPKIGVKQLLKLCQQGQIEIVMLAPDNIKFQPVDKGAYSGLSVTTLPPDCLSLYPHYCEQLLVYGTCTQSDFALAYRINFGKHQLLNITEMFDGRSTWRAFKLDQSYKTEPTIPQRVVKHEIELTTAQLFVRHEELIRVINLSQLFISVESSSMTNKTKSKVPQEFIDVVNELLDKIVKCANEKNLVIDRNSLPFTKSQFWYLYEKENTTLDDITQSTFNDYMKAFGGFSMGRKPKDAKNILPELFPEYYKVVAD